MPTRKKDVLNDLKTIRHQHRIQVFSLLQKQDYTCKELSQKLNLSTVSLYEVLEELVGNNIVSVYSPNNTDRMGRRPVIYKLNENFGYFIVFDFTPPTIKVGIFNLLQKRIDYREYKHYSQITIDYLNEIVDKTKQITEDLQIYSQIKGVGVSVAGRINNKTGFFTVSATFKDAQTINIEQIMSNCFQCPTFVKNNVSLALVNFVEYSEPKIKNALYLYINNGNIGSSILLKHKNHNGDNNLAGEIASTLTLDKTIMYQQLCEPDEETYRQLGISSSDKDAPMQLMKLYDEGNPIAEKWVEKKIEILYILIFNALLILDCNTVIIDCFFVSPSKKAQESFLKVVAEENGLSLHPSILFATPSDLTFLNGGLNYVISKSTVETMK